MRVPTLLTFLLLTCQPGCAVEELQAILDKYDTFGSTGSTDTSTSTGDTSTWDTSTGAQTDSTDSVGGDEQTDGSASSDVSGSAGMSTGATTEPDTSGSGTTGMPAPVCGDGVQEGEEECDDGNAIEGDGCLNNCTREWLVFVTSDPGTQGDIGGVIGADYECRHRATKLFLPNGERYMAWISTSEVQPIDRLYHARGPYKLVNGLQVAANWDALVSGSLDNPVNVTELGETSESLVFTGTLPSGERVPNSSHCDDWTDNDGDNFGWFGGSTESNSDWTYALQVDCGAGAYVICFEQP